MRREVLRERLDERDEEIIFLEEIEHSRQREMFNETWVAQVEIVENEMVNVTYEDGSMERIDLYSFCRDRPTENELREDKERRAMRRSQ